jgi:hypothetical protein
MKAKTSRSWMNLRLAPQKAVVIVGGGLRRQLDRCPFNPFWRRQR